MTIIRMMKLIIISMVMPPRGAARGRRAPGRRAYICVSICLYICMCIYIYMWIEREREIHLFVYSYVCLANTSRTSGAPLGAGQEP